MKNKTLHSIDEILPKPTKKRCNRRRSSFKSNSAQSFECYFESSSAFCKCKCWKEATMMFDLNLFSVMINNKLQIAVSNTQLLCVNQMQNLSVITAHVNIKVGPKQKEGISKLRLMCRKRVDYCLIFERLKSISLTNNSKLHIEAKPFELKYNTLPRIVVGFLILNKVMRVKCFNIVFSEMLNIDSSNKNSSDIKAVIDSELASSSYNQASELRIIKVMEESSVNSNSSIENLKSSICDEWGTKETDFKTKVSNSLLHRFTTFFTKISS